MSRSWVKMFTTDFANQLEDKINEYIGCSDEPIRITAINVISHAAHACYALVAFETVEQELPTIDQVDLAIDILTKSGWLKEHDEKIYNDGFSYGHYMGCCDMKEEYESAGDKSTPVDGYKLSYHFE